MANDLPCVEQDQRGCLLDAAEVAELYGEGGVSTGLLDLITEAIDWDIDDQYVDTLQASDNAFVPGGSVWL